MQTSQQIVRNYLTISGLYTLCASLIWGVNTLFLLDAGLDILGVFIANAVFTGGMAAFEIPTGVLADTKGRRLSFLLSLTILFIGTLGYVSVAATGGGLFQFILYSLVLGLGYTFYSGAVEAWLVDALDATGFEGRMDGIFARGAMVSGCAMLVGTISGGYLGGFDLSIPYWVRSALLAVLFVYAFFTMRDIGFAPRDVKLRALPAEMRKIASASVRFGWSQRSVRFLIVASAFQAFFMAWGYHAWQPYFLGLLGDPDAVFVAGVIAAMIAVAGIVGNLFVDRFSHLFKRRTTLFVGAAVIQTVAMIAVGFVDSFAVAVGLYLVGLAAWSAVAPVKQTYMHSIVSSEQRATVISFDSLVSSGASMAGQGSLGYLAQMRGLASGYVFGGMFSAFAIPVFLILRRKTDAADAIGKDNP